MVWVKAKARRYVAAWLATVTVLIFVMVAIGGLTRLTESGLSIVEWKLIGGVVPPLNHDAWVEAFEHYQEFPQYRIQNPDMTLEEFQFIYWMEFIHRLLGRLIGLVFFFPFAFFWIKGWLGPPMIKRGLILFFLGGLQGLVGWLMVKSGLVDMPRVSHYRLTLHLMLALLVFTLSLWFFYQLTFVPRPETRRPLAPFRKWLLALIGLLGCQIAFGGLVAGLRAGYSYNTFPTMNGVWVPASIFSVKPWFMNFFDNPVMVQFIHRYLGLAAALLVIVLFAKTFSRGDHPRVKWGLILTLTLVFVQVGLGIATLLMRVPVSLASAHQMGALLLWGALLFVYHQGFACAVPAQDSAQVAQIGENSG